MTRILGLALIATLAGCSSEKTPAAKPAAGAQPSGGAGNAGAAKSAPAAPTAAWDALTRPKFRDEEFAAAIAALQPSNGASEAATDAAAGVKRLLGIRQATGWFKVPGITLPREKLESVTIAKIDGIVEGSENPHHVRYQMLAEKYAKEYNGVMVRVIE
jgi:hypothetical protein